MDRDRKKAFELQGKLDRLKKGPVPKGKEKKKQRKFSLPDPSEAVEKRAAKLEALYDDAMTEIQVQNYDCIVNIRFK